MKTILIILLLSSSVIQVVWFYYTTRKRLKKYEIRVWYRYVVKGEQQKDFEVHTIEAKNLNDAFIEAKSYYTSLSVIPFKFECNDVFLKSNQRSISGNVTCIRNVAFRKPKIND